MSMSSSNLRNANVIYNDSSLYRIHQTKQSTDKSCPSTTGPANNSNFVPSFKYTTYPQKPISNSFHADIVNTKTTITNIQTKRLDSVQKTLIFLVFKKGHGRYHFSNLLNRLILELESATSYFWWNAFTFKLRLDNSIIVPKP